jgi:hypothetical protein
MGSELALGRIAGLPVTVGRSALIGSLVLWVVLTALNLLVLQRVLVWAIIVGFIAVVLHWIAVLFHQLGHAWAARRTGYPMIGIRLWGVLSSSIYPPNEPPLPASVHIRRALGGPEASLLLSILSVIGLAFVAPGKLGWWLGLFFFVDNFFTFTVGSLLPLGFTDGTTLAEWWGKR